MKSIISIISILSLGLLIQCQAAVVRYEAPVGAHDLLEGSGTGHEELRTDNEVLDTGHEELGIASEDLATNYEGITISPTEEFVNKEDEELLTGEIEKSVRETTYSMDKEEEIIVEKDVFPIERIIELDVEIVNEEEIYHDAEEIFSEELNEIVRKEENIREEIEENQIKEEALLESILEKQKEEKFQPILVFISAPKDNIIPDKSKGIQVIHEDNASKLALDTMRPMFFVSVGILTLLMFLLLTMLLMTLVKKVLFPGITPRYRFVPDDGTPPKHWLP